MQGSCLTVTPRSGSVPPRSDLRIQVDFVPVERPAACSADVKSPSNPDPTAPGSTPDHEPTVPAPAFDTDADDSAAAPAQRWRQCDNWRIPCFLKPLAGTPPGTTPAALQLNVETVSVRPLAVIEGDGVTFDWARSCYTYAYGPQSIGDGRTVAFRVRNLSCNALPLSVDALSPVGAFEQSNAARAITPGAAHDLRLQFKPLLGITYWEVVQLRVPGQTLRLELTGRGATPKLEIEPAEVLQSCDLGDVVVGGRASKEFELVNTCPFAISYAATFRQLSHQNLGGQVPYYTAPGSGCIQPGGRQKVTIVFSPDHQVRECWCRMCVRAT